MFSGHLLPNEHSREQGRKEKVAPPGSKVLKLLLYVRKEIPKLAWQESVRTNFMRWSFLNRWILFAKKCHSKQDSIPVGCVPPSCRPHLMVSQIPVLGVGWVPTPWTYQPPGYTFSSWHTDPSIYPPHWT